MYFVIKVMRVLGCYYSVLFYKYISFFFQQPFLFNFELVYVNLLVLNFFFIIYKKWLIFCFYIYKFAWNVKIYIGLKKMLSLVVWEQFRYFFFKKYFIIGLGYEVFIYKNYFFLNLGYSHYIKIKLLSTLKVYCKKKRFYIIGFDNFSFKRFCFYISQFCNFNIYKVKGLFWFKSNKYIKNRICMKQGKKKYR